MGSGWLRPDMIPSQSKSQKIPFNNFVWYSLLGSEECAAAGSTVDDRISA